MTFRRRRTFGAIRPGFVAAAGGYTTVYTNTTATGVSGSWIGYEIYNVIGAANLSAASGSTMRLTIKMSILPNTATIKIWVGQKAASGDNIDVTAATAVLFSGNATITGNGSTQEWVSDAITLNEAYDETKAYVFAGRHGVIEPTHWQYDVTNNNGEYTVDGNADIANRAAGTALSFNSHFVKLIEISA